MEMRLTPVFMLVPKRQTVQKHRELKSYRGRTCRRVHAASRRSLTDPRTDARELERTATYTYTLDQSARGRERYGFMRDASDGEFEVGVVVVLLLIIIIVPLLIVPVAHQLVAAPRVSIRVLTAVA
jgi:hypothetical protein